jgi:hypothetical protein
MSPPDRTVVQFALAYGAAALVGAAAWWMFSRTPPPRFGDLFLPGVAMLSFKRSWKAGVCLLAASVAAMLAVVPIDERKLLGFGILTATGALIVWVIELAKRTKPGTPETGKA